LTAQAVQLHKETLAAQQVMDSQVVTLNGIRNTPAAAAAVQVQLVQLELLLVDYLMGA
jgi:hypothetical protein